MDEKTKKAENENTVFGSCETCQFYDYDESYDDYVCGAFLDEDEMANSINSKGCPMYRFYDEYKSVHKQI